MKTVHACLLVATLLLPWLAGGASAQGYPNKPVRIISPYPPGGGNDTLGRIIGEKMAEGLGQRFIIENKPGANTIVGTDYLAKSAPDGYTLILLPSAFVTNPAFYAKLPYDTVNDFSPVGLVANSPQMMVAHPGTPVQSVKEVVAMLKAKPQALSYASSGNGSPGHLAGILFEGMAGVQWTHVGYKGTGPAVADVVAGHVPMMMSAMIAVLPHVKSGKLKLLAVTTVKRLPIVPDAPTVAESGVPGYEAGFWYGMLAPARTPEPVIRALNTQIDLALKQSDVIDKLASQGVEPYYSTPQAFAARIREELPKWMKVITASGVKIE
jgi:tripartite-type tricarboxylate transporter receptor subunit TctC